MREEIYFKNIKDLELFFNYYCSSNHPDVAKKIITPKENVALHLCPTCEELFLYAEDRLSQCELDPKPKCRMCDERCYNKEEWKKMAKLMKYSGIRLGLIKLKNRFFK